MNISGQFRSEMPEFSDEHILQVKPPKQTVSKMYFHLVETRTGVGMLLLIVSSTIFLFPTSASIRRSPAYQEAAFTVANNGRIPEVVMFIKDSNLKQCLVSCMKNKACGSVNHNHSERKCELVKRNYDKGKKVHDAKGWRNYGTPLQVNCSWGSWSEFDNCHAKCGGGYQKKTRYYNRPPSALGGLRCVLEGEGGRGHVQEVKYQRCNTQECQKKEVTPRNDEVTVVDAWSSSDNSNSERFGAQLAWKGNVSGSDGFFHSSRENNPWLRIELKKPTILKSITIINRKDCCGARLKNLEIRGGMNNDLTNPVIGELKGPGVTGVEHCITLSAPTKALFLTFQLKMNAAQLQINGIRFNFICEDKCLLRDTNFAGHDIGVVVKRNSWQDCSLHCEEYPECFAWSFATTAHPRSEVQGNCHMKNAAYKTNLEKNKEEVFSGEKGCGVVEYKFSTESKTWSRAIEECKTWGGFVVAPANPSTNAAVWFKLKSKSGLGDIWLGISDTATEGRWINEETKREMAFKPWNRNEPNGGRSENCVGMLQANGMWFDRQCSLKLAYVCRKLMNSDTIKNTEPKFVVGSQGSIDCPQGSALVTDKKLCKEKVPDAVKKGYQAEGCFAFSAIGCFTNQDNVWYSTCGTRPTASHHSPVCKLLKDIEQTTTKTTTTPTKTPTTTTIIEVKATTEMRTKVAATPTTAKEGCKPLVQLCAKKLFDGTPKEWTAKYGKRIATYSGYWTIDACRCKCQETKDCEEFRVKKKSKVAYSGCMLMRGGTTYMGGDINSYEMYKLVRCQVPRNFIIGTKGQEACPQGSTLVTNKNVCKDKATLGLIKAFGTEKCHQFAAIGCFTNGDKVAYSTCDDKKTHTGHSPICYLVRDIEPTTAPMYELASTSTTEKECKCMIVNLNFKSMIVRALSPGKYLLQKGIKINKRNYWINDKGTRVLFKKDTHWYFGHISVLGQKSQKLRSKHGGQRSCPYDLDRSDWEYYGEKDNKWLPAMSDLEISCDAKMYKLFKGAKCGTSYQALTLSWQKCRDAASSLGFSGDSIADVSYKVGGQGWANTRPQGCFVSGENGRVHFNIGIGGGHEEQDQILCAHESASS